MYTPRLKPTIVLGISPIQKYYRDFYATFIWRASFDNYNAHYHTHTDPANYAGCLTCSKAGGFVTGEMQGDPPMTGYVEFFEPCDDCICNALCPGCMRPLELSFDLSAFSSTDNGAPEVYTDDHGNEYTIPYIASGARTFDYDDALSYMPFDGFTCLVCGWQYDPARHYDNDGDYYDDSEPYASDDPGFDPMFLM